MRNCPANLIAILKDNQFVTVKKKKVTFIEVGERGRTARCHLDLMLRLQRIQARCAC